jgi:hypothetical protein
MTMAHVLMRCLLSLVLGLSGVLSAHAVPLHGEMALPAPTASLEEAPCHEREASDAVGKEPVPEKAASHDCCKPGQCTCACAAPAAAPLAHAASISLKTSPCGFQSPLNYRSYILPLPLRPPIA